MKQLLIVLTCVTLVGCASNKQSTTTKPDGTVVVRSEEKKPDAGATKIVSDTLHFVGGIVGAVVPPLIPDTVKWIRENVFNPKPLIEPVTNP